MNKEYNLGLAKLKEIDGEIGEKVISSLADIAPDTAKYIIEFAFGNIYQRGELSTMEREMITISNLLAIGGCEAQLEVHINGAINVGLTKEKIIETFIQAIPYCGFPRVLNAIFVAKKVFNSKK